MKRPKGSELSVIRANENVNHDSSNKGYNLLFILVFSPFLGSYINYFALTNTMIPPM